MEISPEQFADGLEKSNGILSKLSMKDPLKDVAAHIGSEVSENFVRQENSSGAPWPPHAPLTVALYGPHPLLRLTYTMYAAAVDYTNANAKREIRDREILFGIDGTEIPYATKQNEGSGNIPAREFWYLTPKALERTAEVLSKDIQPLIEKEVLP